MMRARRLQIVDEYVEDGRAAVYTTGGVVLLLSALATSAWQVLGAEWTPVTEVAAVLVQEFGDPGNGRSRDLTIDTLRSMADMSLLELDG